MFYVLFLHNCITRNFKKNCNIGGVNFDSVSAGNILKLKISHYFSERNIVEQEKNL
jgi:hypothetical protein